MVRLARPLWGDVLRREMAGVGERKEARRLPKGARDEEQGRQIAGLQAALSGRQPNRLKAIWEKLDGPALFIAGAFVGSRVR